MKLENLHLNVSKINGEKKRENIYLPNSAWILKLCGLLFCEMEVKEGGYSGGDGVEDARNVVGEKRANLAAIFVGRVSSVSAISWAAPQIYVSAFGYGVWCGHGGDR